MGGTAAGAAKAMRTIEKKYGKSFHASIGAQGGSVKGTHKGFASKKIGADGLSGAERAQVAGIIGGKISRRGPHKLTEAEREEVKRILTNKDHNTAKKRNLLSRIFHFGEES